MKSNTLFFKFIFGAIIFVFSISLAYFTAYYIQTTQTVVSAETAYWLTLLAFAGLYVIVGILVSSIFPISLGFLFCATELLTHVFIRNYDTIPPIYKVSLVGAIVIILEILAWMKMSDPEASQPVQVAPTVTNLPPSAPTAS